MAPDIREPALRDMLELQPWDRMRQVAGQRESFRIDDDESTSPSFHAGFGAVRVIVGRDEEDLHVSTKARVRLSRNRSRLLDLPTSGQERVAILQCPSRYCVLAKLESIGGDAFSQRDDLFDFRNVFSMEHDIEGQWKSERGGPPHDVEFAAERWHSGETVRHGPPRTLNGDLYTINPSARSRESRSDVSGIPLVIRLV